MESSVFPGLPALPGLVWGFGSRREEPTVDLAVTEVRQIHGSDVVCADELAPGLLELDADGLWVSRTGRAAAIRTADCVPVLIAGISPEGARWAAAVHAGWRGTVAEIVGVAVREAVRHGVAAHHLRAMIGPSIGPCCYEVGTEVTDAFTNLNLNILRREGRPHVDLRYANRELLLRAGMPAASIADFGPCTQCASDRYFSFRAEPGEPGRQKSWVGWVS